MQTKIPKSQTRHILELKSIKWHCSGTGASKPSSESLGRGLGHKKPSLEAVFLYKTSM